MLAMFDHHLITLLPWHLPRDVVALLSLLLSTNLLKNYHCDHQSLFRDHFAYHGHHGYSYNHVKKSLDNDHDD